MACMARLSQRSMRPDAVRLTVPTASEDSHSLRRYRSMPPQSSGSSCPQCLLV